MSKAPSFTPRPVRRNGVKTGAWVIFIPDPTKRVGSRKSKGGKEKYFNGEDAQERADAYAEKLRNAWKAQVAGLVHADPKDAIAYRALMRRAKRLGYKSPEELITSIEKTTKLDPTGPTLKDLLEAYAKSMRKDWSKDTISTWNTCRRVVERIFKEKAAAISPLQWEEFFATVREENVYATSTLNRTINYLKSAYTYGMNIGLVQTNPAQAIKRFTKDLERNPVTIRSKQISEFMKHAINHHPQTVPYWAMVFFGGVRPSRDSMRIKWEHILWDRNQYVVPRPGRAQARSKIKRNYYVDMEPNLRKWLEACRQDRGFIAPHGTRGASVSDTMVRRSREIIASGNYCKRDAEGKVVPLIVWGKENRDLTRHTFASAFAKVHWGEEGVNDRLQNALCHTSHRTAEDWYKNHDMSPEEAQAILSIVPTKAQHRKLREFFKVGS